MEGTVVEVVHEVDRNDDTGDTDLYTPIVEFEDLDRRTHRATSLVPHYVDYYPVGTVVSLRYDARDPAGACLIEGGHYRSKNYTASVVYILIGLLVLVGSVVSLIGTLIRGRRAK